MSNSPTYSHGTPEGELGNSHTETGIISPENNTILLQSGGPVDNVVNNLKKNVEEIITSGAHTDILSSNHLRAGGLVKWIENSKANKKWYEENIGKNLKLLDGGRIEILGDVFMAQDEKAPESKQDGVYKNEKGQTLFNRDAAEKHAAGKRIPNWNKYLNFLPGGNNSNKVDFFVNVMGLSFDGCHGGREDRVYYEDISGCYWSDVSNETVSEGLLFTKDDVVVYYDDKLFGFSLRLLEN